MYGSLASKNGVLYVGRHARAARVEPYDFDGRSLGAGFAFDGVDGERADVHGLAVDADHRVWIADRASRRARVFSPFGRELAPVRGREPALADRSGCFGDLTDVEVSGVEDEVRVWIASGGRRRHALHCVDRSGVVRTSMRPLGNPQEEFHGIVRIARSDRLLYACEPAAERIQVFRDDEFHFLLAPPASERPRAGFRPRCAVALADGRVVVAHGDVEAAVLAVFDSSGHVLRVLAEAGSETGCVIDVVDVAIDDQGDDERTRIAVLDRAGDRVQVFTLDGRCFGAFVDLPQPDLRAAPVPRPRGVDRP